MEHINKRNDLLAKRVITGLEKRNMTGYYVQTLQEAKELMITMIKEGSMIASGGSMTIEQCGIKDDLRIGNYRLLERKTNAGATEILEIERQSFFADYYLCSSNAITEDGVLVNIDAKSNRVAAICFGPDKVIMVVSMNKVVSTIEDAMSRARTIAAPINTQRFDIQTPCKTTGQCHDCLSHDTICCQFVTTRYSKYDDRIHVIMVNENAGF